MEQRFNEIIDSYINGNISYVKTRIKKLTKEKRKRLYEYCMEYSPNEANFFFNLI